MSSGLLWPKNSIDRRWSSHISQSAVTLRRVAAFALPRSRLFEIVSVVVCLDHLASLIVNANLDWITGRCGFRTVQPVWFRQGKNLSKNLREALWSFRWDTHHIADATDLKFCLLLRCFF
jgi:hypothetical protein